MSRPWRTLVLLIVLLAAAAPAFGCPVCFGEAEGPMARATQLSILFMAVMTYVLIGGGVATFLVLRRRARTAQPPRENVERSA